MPAYWPWLQPIRSYIQQIDADSLSSQMGSGVSDISEILPEIKVKLPGVIPSPAPEAEVARFRLFDSITSFLKVASENQPIVIVFEDLH